MPASPTYTARACVLRKTKLGEADLIVTLIASDGSQMRAVAKGARKPKSTFASRLELYTEVDVLCARGKSLDIVKEARLVAPRARVRSSLEHAAGAACMAELLERVTQENLPVPRLFDMTHVALDALERAEAEQVPLITAAHLLKALSFAGLRPHLSSCVACGADVDAQRGAPLRLAVAEGGVVCEACARHAQTVPLSAVAAAWAQAALGSTFSQLLQTDAPLQAGVDLLHLAQTWCVAHVGARCKSIEFLLTVGLFA
ncbi:MAG: DNA repair protein RecO [Eggerthellaceae bacterium]|nr:DNA repair protein RecO [Eggerthellaceae bacterium]